MPMKEVSQSDQRQHYAKEERNTHLQSLRKDHPERLDEQWGNNVSFAETQPATFYPKLPTASGILSVSCSLFSLHRNQIAQAAETITS